jgi:nicotinate-nucleotide pyrophosphorylase (carboxylating)
MKGPVDLEVVRGILDLAFAEDLGEKDLTTKALVPSGAEGRAVIRAKADGVIAGAFVADAAFDRFGARYEEVVSDGSRVAPGDVVARIRGPLAALLGAERTALNLLARLSGVASLARKFVDAVAGTRAKILDTRKTTPGYRLLEKYAVRTGGGVNHRMGLDDEILVKENHIAAARAAGAAAGFDAAIRLLVENAPEGTRIGIEVQDLSELHIALEARPAYVLCDNFGLADLALAVEIRDGWPGEGRPEIEASGNVTLANVAEVAATGVDRISVGALTHSAPALDLSMRIEA